MIRVLFVCHGNICRSPMAEFVFKDMVRKRGIADKFFIDSKATSTEELGNGPYYGTVDKLKEMKIPMEPHRSTQLTKKDYNKFDFIIGMDRWNYRNMMRIFGGDPMGKVSLMLSFAGIDRDVEDPWGTDNFGETYDDIVTGCNGLLKKLEEKGLI